MTQNISVLSRWFITDDNRAKAVIKYELRRLESRLNLLLNIDGEFGCCPDEVNALCTILSHGYLEYLNLISVNSHPTGDALCCTQQFISWSEDLKLIARLKQQLSISVRLEEEKKLIAEIAALYNRCTQYTESVLQSRKIPADSQGIIDELNSLFKQSTLQSWLLALVHLWNLNKDLYVEPSLLFHDWSPQQKQTALDFFSKTDLVNLVNAIFFYKLYPDRLFNELIHPEKLISVRMRLGVLHEYIELLQSQLMQSMLQSGIKPGVDLLFHSDNLPQGIMIDVNEECRELVQLAIKQLKVKCTPEKEELMALECLHDLVQAYKYWFNPNRLIDAVMVLRLRLTKKERPEEDNSLIFQREMLLLYQQLTTTESLDLYGYFTNNDSRYLLYTLFSIIQGKQLEWLPCLNAAEKNTIEYVFKALQSVMEALRIELKNRHVNTEPYVYDLEKQHVQAGRRNRDAVLRIIAIYTRETTGIRHSVERLFSMMEKSIQED